MYHYYAYLIYYYYAYLIYYCTPDARKTHNATHKKPLQRLFKVLVAVNTLRGWCS